MVFVRNSIGSSSGSNSHNSNNGIGSSSSSSPYKEKDHYQLRSTLLSYCYRKAVAAKQRRSPKVLYGCLILLITILSLTLWRLSKRRQAHLLALRHAMEATPSPVPIPLPSDDDWSKFTEDYKERNINKIGGPPFGMRSWLGYARLHKCNVHDMYHQIDDDLKFYRNIIFSSGNKLFKQSEIIPFGLSQTDNYMAFTLRNHRLEVVESFNYGGNDAQQLDIEAKLRWILEPIRAHKPPLNATYFFNLHDGATPAKPETAPHAARPLLSVCKQSYWTDENPLPTSDDIQGLQNREFSQDVTASHYGGYDHHYAPVHNPQYQDWAAFESHDLLVPYHFGFDTNIPENPTAKDFDDRKNSIVWRGSTTGSVWGKSPRFRLVEEYSGGSHGHGNNKKHVSTDAKDKTTTTTTSSQVDMDFAFVDILQNSKEQTLNPKSYRFGNKYRLSFQQLQEYKYIMDVDGNAFTARFPNLLRSGSLIFKSTRYKEWYTERLRPYVDYIPVNYDLKDLPAKLEWANDHPELTSKMVLHSQQIAKTYLRQEDMRCYMYRLLLEYNRLFEQD